MKRFCTYHVVETVLCFNETTLLPPDRPSKIGPLVIETVFDNWEQWYTPVFPATLEAKAGRFQNSRLAWAT